MHWLILTAILAITSASTDLKTMQEILHGKYVCSDCLSNYDIGNITSKITERVHCSSSPCGCLSEDEIYRLSGSDASTGICKDNFPRFTLILLHYVQEINSTCDNTWTYLNYVTKATDWFQNNETAEHVVEELLENVMKNYEEEEEEENHTEMHSEGQGQDHNEVQEDHNEERHEDQDNHEEHVSHEEDHKSLSHEKDDHEEHNEDHIVKCFTVDQILDSVGVDHEAESMTREEIESMATEIITYLIRGFRYTPKCSALPDKAKFSKDLYSQLGVRTGQNMKKSEFSELLSQMKIGGSSSPHSEEEEEEEGGHVEHDDHAHARRKRQANAVSINNCYDADSLLAIYDVQNEISPDKFAQICPALVQQQISDACAVKMTQKTPSTVSDAQKYGYGFLAVMLVSLCSLVGLIIVPCTGNSAKNDVLALFIGLAVGSLVGDAMLHLIPAALGVHGGHDHGHGQKEISLEPHVQTGLGILLAIYGFFALESLMDALSSSNSNAPVTHSHSHVMEDKTGSISKQDLTTPGGSPAGSEQAIAKQGLWGIRSVAWMIIIGDGIHNLADGLAIGAAFSVSLKDGLATSIAVLCHELPHEIGDFAVLISSGMSYKMAALLNLLSALTAVVGMFIGAAISASPDISKWIFTIVSGMFVYIALADMVPELIHAQKTAKTAAKRMKRFLLETLGFMLGVLALTLIAIFEEQITF